MWPTAQYNYPLNVSGNPETDEWLEVTQDGVKVSRQVAEAAVESANKNPRVRSVLYIAEDRNED
jgi:hypothetical protein